MAACTSGKKRRGEDLATTDQGEESGLSEEHQTRGGETGDHNKENQVNQINNNTLSECDKNYRRPTYLQFEDFSCHGEGLETYSDGVQHPVELRRILTGDLAKEMSVSFRAGTQDTFQVLIHPHARSKYALDMIESSGRAMNPANLLLPKPPKLFKGGAGSLFSHINTWAENISYRELARNDPKIMQRLKLEEEEEEGVNGLGRGEEGEEEEEGGGGGGCDDGEEGEEAGLSVLQGLLSGVASAMLPSRFGKPGRPPAQQGTFDPDSGTIRYVCRHQCGASLASAKGRRKHEKKHCPNAPKDVTPSYQQQLFFPGSQYMGHSLFGGQQREFQSHRKRESFVCRICGKVLKTYEGRRLHEKLQHIAGKHRKRKAVQPGEGTQRKEGRALDEGDVEEVVEEEEDEDESTKKSILIDHLKAAGLDPNMFDEEDDDEIEDDLEDEEEEEEEGSRVRKSEKEDK